VPPATILISGASGFIGAHLARELAREGHRVARLARPQSKPMDLAAVVPWDPARHWIDHDALRRLAPQVVVNLAGARIDQRWTSGHRRAIRDSRVAGTRLLEDAIAALSERPRVMISGSAVGYYGAHRGDEILSEDTQPGNDFLANTAGEWEDAAAGAAAAGIRVVRMRTGVVLGRRGGALARLLPIFRFGIGGRIGNGRQWMSWIALTDVMAAIRHLIARDAISGAVNVVAPEPARNSEFTSALGRVLHRPTLLPVPALALRMIFGTMARDTILASQRAIPTRLRAGGFVFGFPEIDAALRHELRG
jgi:uncharacterized protein